jgi:hypothetical protein
MLGWDEVIAKATKRIQTADDGGIATTDRVRYLYDTYH